MEAKLASVPPARHPFLPAARILHFYGNAFLLVFTLSRLWNTCTLSVWPVTVYHVFFHLLAAETAGVSLLQMVYWIVMVLFLPWSVLLLPFTGFWLILYTANFLLYNTLNNSFQIEEQIANAFPEQIPFYEDDEAWLKRKQEETNESNNNDC